MTTRRPDNSPKKIRHTNNSSEDISPKNISPNENLDERTFLMLNLFHIARPESQRDNAMCTSGGTVSLAGSRKLRALFAVFISSNKLYLFKINLKLRASFIHNS